MAVYHLIICRSMGGCGGGIADKPSASVVSELQHKLKALPTQYNTY